MSKIVYVGKFKKSSTGTEDAVVAAMRELGHEVHCVDYLNESVCAVAGYDLAIFSKCEGLGHETIKSYDCKKAMWIFDSLHDTTMKALRSGAEELIEKGKLMDRLFTAAPGDVETYKNAGCKTAYYLPQACDNRIFYDRITDRDLDITFVGNNYGNYRADLIRYIYKRYGPRFKLFSKTNTWGMPVERSLSQEEAAVVFSRSKITLNMSETPQDDKWSRRVWDAMGCGAIVAAQRCASFSNFFLDELLVWDKMDEMFEKIDNLLDNEHRRYSISKNAKFLIRDRHTYRHRVKELLSVMGLEG